MLASHKFAMLAKIWSSHLDVRLYTLCRLPLTALSLVFLLFSSPHIPSSQPTSARDAPNSPQLSAGRFIAMLQIQSGETRRGVAVRVDRIAMAIGGDVEAYPFL